MCIINAIACLSDADQILAIDNNERIFGDSKLTEIIIFGIKTKNDTKQIDITPKKLMILNMFSVL